MKHIYSRFLLSVLISTLALICVYGILVYSLYSLPRPESKWIRDLFAIKEHALERIKGPRVIFVGGSATLFGANAKNMAQELHMPIINYATHAGLGLDYFIHKIKKAAKPGDIVILPLEYQLLDTRQRNPVLINYVLSFDKPYFQSLSLPDQAAFLLSVHPKDMIRRLLDNVGLRKAGYGSENVNEYGDQTLKEGNNIASAIPIRFESALTAKDGLQKIAVFAQWCKSSNITFLYAFPGTIDFKEYHSSETIICFENFFKFLKANHIETLNDPYKSFMPITMFYDTSYHTNTEGSNALTALFIDAIREKIVDVGFH